MFNKNIVSSLEYNEIINQHLVKLINLMSRILVDLKLKFTIRSIEI